MIRIAVYGKGGIGKSTTVSNMAAALAQSGKRVMQIGCDPKADSTLNLRRGEPVPTLLELFRRDGAAADAHQALVEGFAGVICAEAGGPVPGVGCAGRGIITALEMLDKCKIYNQYQPDVVFFDVPGDVVCGGFSMPMRYADRVFVMTSGENMALYAAKNIAEALARFRDRGYARLGGLILNRRGGRRENEKTEALALELNTVIAGAIDRDELILDADDERLTVLEAFPESEPARQYRALARAVLERAVSC